jgi:hypothetical protein
MSEMKKPVCLKIQANKIGDFAIWLRCDTLPEWTEESGARRTHWVDFEIFEAVGRENDGTLLFGEHFFPELEIANPTVHGFVKWDGCTQFWFGDPADSHDGAHVDSKADLDKLFAAIHLARAEAAKILKMEEG